MQNRTENRNRKTETENNRKTEIKPKITEPKPKSFERNIGNFLASELTRKLLIWKGETVFYTQKSTELYYFVGLRLLLSYQVPVIASLFSAVTNFLSHFLMVECQKSKFYSTIVHDKRKPKQNRKITEKFLSKTEPNRKP